MISIVEIDKNWLTRKRISYTSIEINEIALLLDLPKRVMSDRTFISVAKHCILDEGGEKNA